MPLVVQKFGGSSVATAERITAAARRAIRAQKAGNQVIVVVSARGDTTDELISLAREISDRPPAREMDMLLSTGEQISIALMAMAIQALGQPAQARLPRVPARWARQTSSDRVAWGSLATNSATKSRFQSPPEPCQLVTRKHLHDAEAARDPGRADQGRDVST